MLCSSVMPASGVTPRVVATTCTSDSSSSAAASSQNHAPWAKRGSTSAATCTDRRVLPTPPTPVSVTRRAASSCFARATSSASRPTNDVTWAGRLPGNASSDPIRGELARQVGMDHLEHALGAGEVAERVLAEVEQLDAVLGHELLGGERHDDLSAMRRRHQSSRAVHRGAVVVALAELLQDRCGSPCARATDPSRPTARLRA